MQYRKMLGQNYIQFIPHTSINAYTYERKQTLLGQSLLLLLPPTSKSSSQSVIAVDNQREQLVV